MWHLEINDVMEIVDEEDWEGIPIKNNNKVYVCCFHQGFMRWHRLKDEEEKQLPVVNVGSCCLQTMEAQRYCARQGQGISGMAC